MDTLLFKTEHIKKLFNILDRLERTVDVKYNNKCAREVFIRRSIAKWLKNKYLVWLCKSEDSGFYYNRYVTIMKVEYALHYATELNVRFFDYSRPMDIWNTITLDHNSLLNLEGNWCKNGNIHNKILKLTVPNLPLREFVFKTYDFNLYPKRKKKSQTQEDIYKLMESTISFKASTHKEAYQMKKDFEKVDNGKLLICPDIIKINDI
jgi:hypothetical protein